MKNILLIFALVLCTLQMSFAQEEKDISEMTKEDVLELTYDQLLEMPFEDLLKLAEIVGVSLDELYEMILNKDVVSASKKVESSFESPLSTSVISYDEIKASGARTMEEALRLVPGMIVREKTNGNFDAHIRGNDNLPPHHFLLYSENSITLVMIDGRPVYNYVHGGTFWETLPVDIEDVERIEVVRGPSSALYGPNAVSGVVNIITKRQESKEFKADAHVEGGSQKTILTSVGVGKGITDKLSFRVTGNYQTMNRNSDLLYVHAANNGEGGYVSREDLDTMTSYSAMEGRRFFVYDPGDNVYDMYPEPESSRDRFGLNGYLFYDISDDIKIDLKGGYQNSEITSTTMGDNPTPYAGRISNTSYLDLNARIHDLRAQVNYLGGWQDIIRQDTGFKVSTRNINANLEYDFHLGSLNIRPGIAYQQALYDDMPYLRYDGQGFLNGARKLSTTAFSLRADYLLFERLRLIGAIRGEKYSIQDNIYPTFQLIGAYNMNDMHFFRVVYGRANRGPFLVDSYANYRWVREGRPLPGVIYFEGNKDLDLVTMDMVEVGYRVKPVKSVQADFEFFMTKSKNYSALYPDSVSLLEAETGRPYTHMLYQNVNLSTRQMGATASISWVINKNIVLKVYGTVQNTKIYDVISVSPDDATEAMLTDAFVRNALDSTVFFSRNFDPEEISEEDNVHTPDFYGGLILSANALDEKLWFNANMYTYTAHEMRSKYSTEDETDKQAMIDSKVILNMKVSYKVFGENSVFINVRNILGEKREYAYMDEIGSLYLFGVDLKF